MITYEEALKRLMDAEKLDRGAAVQRLVKAYDENDPELGKVSGLVPGFFEDYTKGTIQQFGAGLKRGVVGPVVDLAHEIGNYFDPRISKAVPYGQEAEQQAYKDEPPIPLAEGAGELVGSTAPFMAVSGGVGALGVTSELAKNAIAGGVIGGIEGGPRGILPGAVGGAAFPYTTAKGVLTRAAAGGVIGGLYAGPSGAAIGAGVAVGAPAVAARLGNLLFGREAPVETYENAPVPPEVERVKESEVPTKSILEPSTSDIPEDLLNKRPFTTLRDETGAIKKEHLKFLGRVEKKLGRPLTKGELYDYHNLIEQDNPSSPIELKDVVESPLPYESTEADKDAFSRYLHEQAVNEPIAASGQTLEPQHSPVEKTPVGDDPVAQLEVMRKVLRNERFFTGPMIGELNDKYGISTERFQKLWPFLNEEIAQKRSTELNSTYKPSLWEFQNDLDKVVGGQSDPQLFAMRWSHTKPGDFNTQDFIDLQNKIATEPKAVDAIQRWLKESDVYQANAQNRAGQLAAQRLQAREQALEERRPIVGRRVTHVSEVQKIEEYIEPPEIAKIKKEISAIESKIVNLDESDASVDTLLDQLNDKKDELSEAQQKIKTPKGVISSKVDQALSAKGEGTGKGYNPELKERLLMSYLTPMQALGVKSAEVPVPSIYGEGDLSNFTQVQEQYPELADAILTVGARHPRLMKLVKTFGVEHFGPEFDKVMAITSYDPKSKSIHMAWNTRFLPTTKDGQAYMLANQITTPEEFHATILEHELTHVAQYWAESRGLRKTFGVPPMVEGQEHVDINDPTTWEKNREISEMQAERREERLRAFFQRHAFDQKMAKAMPDTLKAKLLHEYASEQAAKYIAEVKQRLQFRAKTSDPFDPDSMDDFDKSSRGLNDVMAAPSRLLPPELQKMQDDVGKYGLKRGSTFVSPFRHPLRASRAPEHIWFIGRSLDIMREAHKMGGTFRRHIGNTFKELNLKREDYDSVWEAVEGLRRKGGQLVQTVQGVDPRIAKIAERIRDRVYDPLWEHVYQIDRRAPEILTDLGLPSSERQWRRIQALQKGLKITRPNVLEVEAAKRMKGMLNFDESTDLRGEFVDGYITHQPIANERAELKNQIDQLQKMPSGYNDPHTQALLQERLKRLSEVELQLARARMGKLPPRDVLPRRHYYGPVSASDHPGAAQVLVDKDIPKILGRYINGVIMKRAFDKLIFEFKKVEPFMAATVKDYDVNYINGLRGAKGYREDIGLADFVDSYNKFTNKNIDIGSVRKVGAELMHWQNLMKLYLNQIRFPIVQAAHLALTNFIEDPIATYKGLSYFLSSPKKAIKEAMAEGLVDRDDEFLGALDEVSPTNRSKLLKLMAKLTQFSDAFRKSVTYHGFRLRYNDPGYKASPTFLHFQADVPGRNRIQAARDYGIAATDILQFRQRAEGKPQAYVGGVPRRLWGQFKQWPTNIAGLYSDIARQRNPAKIGRMLAVLYTFGGLSFGVEPIYNKIRQEALKHGDRLPAPLRKFLLSRESGWQMAANALGIGDHLKDVDIMSLRDPIGLPRSLKVDDLVGWAAGPTFGGIIDYISGLEESGDVGRDVKSTISAISPQLRAGIDAYEEYKTGGVRSPTGRIQAMRSPSQIIIRGLDLSPSVRTVRFQYRQDIITALEAGQRQTALQLFQEAKKKGIVFGRSDVAQIKAKVKGDLRRSAILARDKERVLQ